MAIRVRSADGNSFDHLVGAQEDARRQLDADRLCGLQIDHCLIRDLFDREIGLAERDRAEWPRIRVYSPENF